MARPGLQPGTPRFQSGRPLQDDSPYSRSSAGCESLGERRVRSFPGRRSTRAARRLLSRHLHRQSVGALTSRAFPRTASAFAIAAREQCSRAVTPGDGFAPRMKETHQVNRVPLTDLLTAHPQLALSHKCERPLRLLAGFRHGRRGGVAVTPRSLPQPVKHAEHQRRDRSPQRQKDHRARMPHLPPWVVPRGLGSSVRQLHAPLRHRTATITPRYKCEKHATAASLMGGPGLEPGTSCL